MNEAIKRNAVSDLNSWHFSMYHSSSDLEQLSTYACLCIGTEMETIGVNMGPKINLIHLVTQDKYLSSIKI